MGDDDEMDTTTDLDVPQHGSAGKGKSESLEQLLLARNKKLGDELTVLRVSHQDLQRRLEALQGEVNDKASELEKAKALTATLENDLLNVQQEASNAFPSSAMSVAGTYTSRYPSSSFPGRRGRAASPTSSIISGFDPQSSSQSTMDAIGRGEAVGGGSGMLPMVVAQRDRFKKKISDLETELQKQYQAVSSLRSEVSSLQKDNLNLYEKTRYVSTYSRNHPASSSSAYSSNPNPTTIQVSSDTPSGLSLDRYRSAYEQNISPFAAFRGRESARAFKRMNFLERGVFQVTRMVLATRTSRNLFAAYCVALHLMVLLMLYWMGTGDLGSASDPATAAMAAAGPLKVAADADRDWHQEGFQEGG